MNTNTYILSPNKSNVVIVQLLDTREQSFDNLKTTSVYQDIATYICMMIFL